MKKSVLATVAIVPLALVLAACGSDEAAESLPTAVATPTQSYAPNGEGIAVGEPNPAAPETPAAEVSEEIVDLNNYEVVDNGDGTVSIGGETVESSLVAEGGQIPTVKPLGASEKYTGGYPVTEAYSDIDLNGAIYSGPLEERAKFAQAVIDAYFTAGQAEQMVASGTISAAADTNYRELVADYSSAVAFMNSCGGLRDYEAAGSVENAKTTIKDDGAILRVEKTCTNPNLPKGQRTMSSVVDFDIKFDKGSFFLRNVEGIKAVAK